MEEYYCLGPVGFIFVLGGAYIGFRVIKAWKLFRSSENWVPIVGLVTKSEVEYLASTGADDSDTYTPIITYTYQLMGNSYEGNRIEFGSEGVRFGKRKKAEVVIARHPLGSQPTVYYDPEDPAQSVLERKWNSTNTILFLILELIGAVLIYLDFQYWN